MLALLMLDDMKRFGLEEDMNRFSNT